MNPNGTGLGLKMSHDLAKLLGPIDGKGIQVESVFKEGAKFYFLLRNN